VATIPRPPASISIGGFASSIAGLGRQNGTIERQVAETDQGIFEGFA
jgi:hypothetical protein